MNAYTNTLTPVQGELIDRLNIGLVTPDRAIGCRETLRRMLGVLGGTIHPAALDEAVSGFVVFYFGRDSGAVLGLDNLAGKWRRVFRLCQFKLRKIRSVPACGFCGSADRRYANHRDGMYLGIACCGCGHIAPPRPLTAVSGGGRVK